ncbi:hypothetical protein Pmani_003756 [Petrolisthes manimaculis]|uniref:Uncharacterized protein n=1 Tax=Petrolisthes manimaculis TaxID=1843537 RepID=A0AAE1QHX0_9EUCA|nr:hypothetical protein Pmani_003756 [Petrolisthes manimaculis]
MVNTWEPELERTGEQLMAHTQRQWELFRARGPRKSRTSSPLCPTGHSGIVIRLVTSACTRLLTVKVPAVS